MKIVGVVVGLAKKYAPELLTATGIVGGVSAAVMAVKASPKTVEVREHTKDMVDATKYLLSSGQIDPNQYRKEITYVYVRHGLDMTKVFSPAIVLGLGSIVSIVSAHGVMAKRNAALIGAIKVVESSFSKYRSKVADILGVDKEGAIYRGIKVQEDDEGTPIVEYDDSESADPYGTLFDNFNSSNYQMSNEANRMFLRAQQNYWNDVLQARGHVFLNEVYDGLGVKRTSLGAVTGWVKDSVDGDGFINFSIFELDIPERNIYDVDGISATPFYLDFNVDGTIVDLI